MSAHDEVIDATGPLVLEGDAFAINRIMEACKEALRPYEFNRKETTEKSYVLVPGPDPTGH